MDRGQRTLADALRQGVDQDEIRLYRAGKLPGLFGARTALNAELADHALRTGLIEVVRTEARGKSPLEWVRVTARGVDFVLRADSPVRALDELRDTLALNRDGIPRWLAELQGQVEELGQRLTAEVASLRERLDGMMVRVQEALRRADKYGPPAPEGVAETLAWAHDALDYLERRPRSGLADRCPLPELFTHLRDRESALTIGDFHSGLRRLHDRGLIRLLSADATDGPAEPEYALLDGPRVFYFAAPAAA